MWRWAKAPATARRDLGNPFPQGGTDYELCIYDGAPKLIATAFVPAGGKCDAGNSHACWRAKARGFTYSNRGLMPEGIQEVILKAGTTNSQILVKGKGNRLAIPPLPILDFPVIVELKNSDGMCWATTHTSTRRNLPEEFVSKSD
jgi:hypothetical protein